MGRDQHELSGRRARIGHGVDQFIESAVHGSFGDGQVARMSRAQRFRSAALMRNLFPPGRDNSQLAAAAATGFDRRRGGKSDGQLDALAIHRARIDRLPKFDQQRQNSRLRGCSNCRTIKPPRRADVRQWISRRLSPGCQSRRP